MLRRTRFIRCTATGGATSSRGTPSSGASSAGAAAGAGSGSSSPSSYYSSYLSSLWPSSSAPSSTSTSTSTPDAASWWWRTSSLSSCLSGYQHWFSPFYGLSLGSVADVQKNTPSILRPIKRWKYRQYVLKNYKPSEQEESTVAATLKSVGLEPQATFGVLVIYIGTLCAFSYYTLSVVWHVMYFAGGGAAPTDPRRLQKNNSNSHHQQTKFQYADEFCPLDPKRVMTRVQRDCSDSIIIFHGAPGTGKSTLLRRVGCELACPIYVKATPSITASDPLEMVGQYYGGLSGYQVSYVFWILQKFLRRKPTLIFDVESSPGGLRLVSSSRYNTTTRRISDDSSNSNIDEQHRSGAPTNHHHKNIKVESNYSEVQMSSAGAAADLSSSSSSASSGGGQQGASSKFQLQRFLEHSKALVCSSADENTSSSFRILLALDTALLYSDAPPSFVHNSEYVSEFEVGELSVGQANKLVTEMTHVYTPSLTPYMKRTVRFLKDRLGKHILNQQEEETARNLPPELALGPAVAAAKTLLRSEYRQMESSASSIFENCYDGKKLRELAAENNELIWSEIEQYCSNKYGSNEQFRLVAEVREGLFTSTGTSTYRPRYDVIRDKVLPGESFLGEKKKKQTK